MIWRLVGNRVATLQEIDSHYDLIDVLDANETLDILHAAEALAYKGKR